MKEYLFIILICLSGKAYSQSPALDSLKSWMHFLSADERKGRANGSVESVQVADWIKSEFEKWGVKPLPGSDWLFHDYQNPNGGAGLTNVIGYIPGKSEDLYIILSAHYDHVGIAGSGGNDDIFNGADDDASGICMLLGIAKRIFEDTIKPECSIVLAAFSGEELGKLGSRAFCESDAVAWDKVKLNLNFELTGRSGEFGRNKYYITGPANSNLIEILNGFNENSTWMIADAGHMSNILYQAADNYSFVKFTHSKKICFPAHTVATSIGMDYLHKVDDEEEYIDFENLNGLIEYTTVLIYFLSKEDVILSCNEHKRN